MPPYHSRNLLKKSRNRSLQDATPGWAPRTRDELNKKEGNVCGNSDLHNGWFCRQATPYISNNPEETRGAEYRFFNARPFQLIYFIDQIHRGRL